MRIGRALWSPDTDQSSRNTVPNVEVRNGIVESEVPGHLYDAEDVVAAWVFCGRLYSWPLVDLRDIN